MAESSIVRKKFNVNTTLKSFPLLAIEQFERLILSHNVELRGGFYLQNTGINGDVKESYVPDTREVFCNTCKALAFLISPAFTKAMKERYEEILNEVKEIETHFLENSTVDESIVLGESFYEKEEDKILLEEYNNKKVAAYQKLFEAICIEFQRHRYWQTSSMDD